MYPYPDTGIEEYKLWARRKEKRAQVPPPPSTGRGFLGLVGIQAKEVQKCVPPPPP